MTGRAAVKRSPLAGMALPEGLREVPFLAQVDLRAEPGDAALLERFALALGHPLPLDPNTASGREGQHALWLGPDEWLLVGAEGTEATIEARCRAALGTALGSVVDVSANRTALELSGPAARSVLETSCSLDLHPRTFAAGRCAQTSLARIPVILPQLTEEPRYRILVRPSFAIHLATWLRDACAGGGRAAPTLQ